MTPEVTVDDPRVLVGRMTHEDGREFVWFVSQHEKATTAVPAVRRGTLVSLDGGKLSEVELPPYGVLVAELTA